MDLQEIGEFGLIARIKNRLPAMSPQVFQGMGDAAAVSSLSPGMDLVSTVDLLVKNVHFDLSLTTARQLGRKSLGVNLSDIAAMGAAPLFMLVSLAIPPKTPVEFIDEFSAKRLSQWNPSPLQNVKKDEELPELNRLGLGRVGFLWPFALLNSFLPTVSHRPSEGRLREQKSGTKRN